MGHENVENGAQTPVCPAGIESPSPLVEKQLSHAASRTVHGYFRFLHLLFFGLGGIIFLARGTNSRQSDCQGNGLNQ